MAKAAIYPGSFDPLTFGHLDIIKRATKMFDHVIVAVAENSQKKPLFEQSDRIAMIEEATQGIAGVSIEVFDGLVIDYAQSKGINVLVRGLRMISDFEYELQMALTNRRLNEKVETVFLMPSEGYSFLSSTLIKEAAALGADISSFVPENVVEKFRTLKQ